MNQMLKIKNLLKENNGIITSKQVMDIKINTAVLSKMVKQNLIEKIGGGVYTDINTINDDYFVFQQKCKKAIFSHETALFFHDLCDRTPINFMATIPMNYDCSEIRKKENTFIRIKRELYEIGITNITTPFGKQVKVYDRERTICDIVRNKDKIDISLFTDAIKRYVRSNNKDYIKLFEYADKFKISKDLRKYLEVLV